MDKKKGALNVFFLLMILGFTFYYVFHDKDIGRLMDYIELSDTRYWIIAIIFVIMFILGESVIIYYLFRKIGHHVKFSHCCMYSFVGFFFSSITPSATGGQPMQIVYMKKDGIPMTLATFILMIVTIGYKLVLVLLGLGVMLFRPVRIMEYLAPIWGWCILGIVLNVVAVGVMLLFVLHTKLAVDMLYAILQTGIKWKLIKDRTKWEKRISSTARRYGEVSCYLKKNPRVGLHVVLLSIVQRFLLFSVTAVIYLSFGLEGSSLVDITALQGMVSVAVDMLPTPGGMGFSEGLFLVAFEPIYGNLTLSGLVVSRGISYYTQLLICLVVSVFVNFRLSKNNR